MPKVLVWHYFWDFETQWLWLSISGKVFRIGTVRYNWPMSAHASQAFSIAHCTDSEDLPISAIIWAIGDERAAALQYLIRMHCSKAHTEFAATGHKPSCCTFDKQCRTAIIIARMVIRRCQSCQGLVMVFRLYQSVNNASNASPKHASNLTQAISHDIFQQCHCPFLPYVALRALGWKPRCTSHHLADYQCIVNWRWCYISSALVKAL